MLVIAPKTVALALLVIFSLLSISNGYYLQGTKSCGFGCSNQAREEKHNVIKWPDSGWMARIRKIDCSGCKARPDPVTTYLGSHKRFGKQQGDVYENLNDIQNGVRQLMNFFDTTGLMSDSTTKYVYPENYSVL